jgi:hypothetical protein
MLHDVPLVWRRMGTLRWAVRLRWSWRMRDTCTRMNHESCIILNKTTNAHEKEGRVGGGKASAAVVVVHETSLGWQLIL